MNLALFDEKLLCKFILENKIITKNQSIPSHLKKNTNKFKLLFSYTTNKELYKNKSWGNFTFLVT